MKKAIIFCLCAILLFSFAGCSPNAKDDGLKDNTSSNSVTMQVFSEPIADEPSIVPTEKPTEIPTEKPTEKQVKAPVSSAIISNYSSSSSSRHHYEASSSSIEQTKNSMTVYITPSGKRYHYSSTCGGKNSYAVSIDEVGGRTPCKKCVH